MELFHPPVALPIEEILLGLPRARFGNHPGVDLLST
jgi:hypothetical protein